MRNIGMDIEMLGFVYQNGGWYFSHEILGKLGEDIKKWMAKNNKTIFDISDSCKKFYESSKKKILQIVKDKRADREAMEELWKIFRMNTNYIWLAHGLEESYMKLLKQEVPKHWKGDTELFIGDISFPEKKTVHAIFEDKLRSGEDLLKIQKEFGWIRTRGGFEEPFNIEELKEIREKLKGEKQKPNKKVKVPEEIKQLIEDMRELIFYRTYRTDILYELLFLAMPIIKKYTEGLGLKFKEISNCRIDDLINGVIKKYPDAVNVAQYKNDYAFFDENVVEEDKIISEDIKGSIAFMGIAKGVARIILSVKDLPKIKDGDVLVTNMTTPNYLIAMKRAVAFVTDEGGITCHAAIVAREMKKPCIIGTKNATRLLNDGDIVEVDANRGIVKILAKDE
jgi:phosphoenolpyruvate synthase/pyruvate phosphate dikinase